MVGSPGVSLLHDLPLGILKFSTQAAQATVTPAKEMFAREVIAGLQAPSQKSLLTTTPIFLPATARGATLQKYALKALNLLGNPARQMTIRTHEISTDESRKLAEYGLLNGCRNALVVNGQPGNSSEYADWCKPVGLDPRAHIVALRAAFPELTLGVPLDLTSGFRNEINCQKVNRKHADLGPLRVVTSSMNSVDEFLNFQRLRDAICPSIPSQQFTIGMSPDLDDQERLRLVCAITSAGYFVYERAAQHAGHSDSFVREQAYKYMNDNPLNSD